MFLARAIADAGGGPDRGRAARPAEPQARDDRERSGARRDRARFHSVLVSTRPTGCCIVLSAMLMFASPFFTSGRASILPGIATPEELHTANTMTQTTSWASLTIGAFLARWACSPDIGSRSVSMRFRLSFRRCAFRSSGARRFSAPKGRAQSGRRPASRSIARACAICGRRRWCGRRDDQRGMGERRRRGADSVQPVRREGVPRGPVGIGIIWGCAGIGLLIGGSIGYWLGKRLSFVQYKRTIAIVYLIHGGAYVLFSQMPTHCLGVRVHCDFARGGGDEFGAEFFAVAASCGGPVSRARVRDAGISDVVDDDDFDDGGGGGDDHVSVRERSGRGRGRSVRRRRFSGRGRI